MKLGVVAGMGPFASTYFLHRVLEFTPAKKEWDYFRIFADFNVFIPSRTRALLYGETSPAPEIVKTINKLQKMGADIIAVPCNSAHGWYYEVSEHINIPWLNLIKVTSDAVKKRGMNKVMVISAYVPVAMKLYDKYINAIYPTNAERQAICQLIERLKLGENTKIVKNEFSKVIGHYRDKVDCLVIACTEPSMLFGINETSWNGFQIVDSTNEYAKKCVEICKGIEL